MTQAGTNPIKFEDLRVLVVDDHMMMRNMIMQNLRSLGIQNIESASNGVDGYKELHASMELDQPYNIVFLDWHMPEMEGVDLLKRCREDERFNQTAFIMLTAEQEEKNILKAIEVGATSYMVKPVARDAMEKNLYKIISWLQKNNAKIGKKNAKADDEKAEEPALPDNFSEELRGQLKPVVAKSVEQIFSELFNVKIMPEELTTQKEQDMVCIGRLHQNNMLIILRFFFDQELLKPLLMQLYAPKFLDDQKVYEDAACEIVNILCNQIKAFLNKHGYELELDLPEIGTQKRKCKNAHSIMNIHFSLNEDQCFLVDISSKTA